MYDFDESKVPLEDTHCFWVFSVCVKDIIMIDYQTLPSSVV